MCVIPKDKLFFYKTDVMLRALANENLKNDIQREMGNKINKKLNYRTKYCYNL